MHCVHLIENKGNLLSFVLRCFIFDSPGWECRLGIEAVVICETHMREPVSIGCL